MNLETRIREHYDPKDHPSVFELLDELQKQNERYQQLRDDQLRISAKNEQLDDENARLQKIKAGDSAEFIRMDTALDELTAENARLRGAIEEVYEKLYRKCSKRPHGRTSPGYVIDACQMLRKALENPNA